MLRHSNGVKESIKKNLKDLHPKQKLVVSTEYISENPSDKSSDFVPADKPNWFWANQN